MPKYKKNRILSYVLSVEETMDGTGAAGAGTITGYTNVKHTLPANLLRDNDEIKVSALYDVVGAGGATNFQAHLFWGGTAGVGLAPTVNMAVNVSNEVCIEASIFYRTTGASSDWHSRGIFTTPANTSYYGNKQLFAQGTQDSNSAIVIQPALQYNGGTPGAGDQVRCRKLTIDIYRRRAV